MKPKICEIFGVELDEVFETCIDGTVCECKIITDKWGDYRLIIRIKGEFMWSTGSSVDLLRLIEDPTNVIHIQKNERWTQEDIGDAQAIKRLFPTCKYVYRNMIGNVVGMDGDKLQMGYYVLGDNLIHSLKVEDGYVKLDDIRGEN